ncbi:MAG TPA: NnrS family protein, partial [Acidiferrobacterales bacterium]|nr:NnrS family protein [Acidiferrobacterales bacterium]
MSTPVSARPSVWQVFSAEPHRMLFLAGATQILLVLAWWLVELTTRATGFLSPATALPATWGHAFLMVYGVFPFFIFG